MQSSQMELTIEEANKYRSDLMGVVKLADALHRLNSNPDFIMFKKAYEEDEAIRTTHLLADITFNSHNKEFNRAEINERLIGIARFVEFKRNIYMCGERALTELSNLNNVISQSSSSNE